MTTYFARLQKVVSYTRVFTVLTALFDFAIVTVGQRGWTLYHQRSFIHFSLKRFEPDLLLIAGGHSILFFSHYYSLPSLILAKSGFYQLLW